MEIVEKRFLPFAYGYFIASPTEAVYADAHDANEGTFFGGYYSAGKLGQLWIPQGGGSGVGFHIYRGIWQFEVGASIWYYLQEYPESIISAYIRVAGETQDYSRDAEFDIAIVPAEDIFYPPDESDYGTLLAHTTDLGSISSESWKEDDWNYIYLSSDAILYMKQWMIDNPNKSYWPFGVRSSRDISSVAPTTDGEIWCEYVTIADAFSHTYPLPSGMELFVTYIDGLDECSVYPLDISNTTRVSSIRRIYHPGLYRMELALGDLGFDVDVSEAAIQRVPDEVVVDKKDEELVAQIKEVRTRVAQEESKFRKELQKTKAELDLKNYQPTPQMEEYKKTSVSSILQGLPTTPQLLEKPTPTNILATLSPVAIGKTIYEAGKSLVTNLFKGLFG